MLGLPAPYRTPWQYALHSNRSYTLAGGSRLAAGSSIFHDPPLLPRTIAYTATEQVHQQMPGRSHPHTRLVGIRIRSSTFLGRSRMLQSSYTSRCLADRIRIYWLDRYGSGEEDGRRWLPGYEPGAIRIVRDHLLRRLA